MFGFVFGLFAGFFPRWTPLFGHLDCVLVRALFRLPNAGTYRALHNSFNGTNTVLRPGESREGEGRKKNQGADIEGGEDHPAAGVEIQERILVELLRNDKLVVNGVELTYKGGLHSVSKKYADLRYQK